MYDQMFLWFVLPVICIIGSSISLVISGTVYGAAKFILYLINDNTLNEKHQLMLIAIFILTFILTFSMMFYLYKDYPIILD
jgi:hypothetical protein